MKKIFILFSICMIALSTVHAQSRREKKEAERDAASRKAVDADDPDFSVTTVPDKWKNESAVVIAQKLYYEYYPGQVIRATESIHCRVKLQDRAAVQEFSTFYFNSTPNFYIPKNEDAFLIRIIKPDGTEKTYTKKEAVDAGKADIPLFFRARVRNSAPYFKLAVPDLEPGDIFDFYVVDQSSIFNEAAVRDLPLVETNISNAYPVMKFKLNFRVGQGFYVTYKALNGAPKIKKDKNIDEYTYSYSTFAQDVERNKEERWVFEDREYPTIKFQLVFVRKKTPTFYFVSDQYDIPSDTMTSKAFAEKMNEAFSQIVGYMADLESVLKTLKKEGVNKTTDKKTIVKKAYYILRTNGDFDDSRFCRLMYEVCKDYQIPCEFVVTADRSNCDIRDLMFYNETYFLLKIMDDYVYPFVNLHSTYESVNARFHGANAYVVKIDKKKENQTSSLIQLPGTKPEDNLSKTVVTASLNTDSMQLLVEENVTIHGCPKISYKETVLYGFNNYESNYEAYNAKIPPLDIPKEGKKLDEYLKDKTTRDSSRWESKKKLLMSEMSDSYKDVVALDTSKVIFPGRTSEKNDLVYYQKFRLGSMVKKVGSNYALSIGELIGEQVDLREREKNRKYNIWLVMPRVLEYEINYTIPDGYKVKGVEALKISVDNVAGSFNSTAKVEGNKLIITTKKVYKNNFYSKDEWSKMEEFLDAAYNFTQRKVILAKS